MPITAIASPFWLPNGTPIGCLTSFVLTMAAPSAEQLEAMLLKGLPRYRWTADDVVKGMDLKEWLGGGEWGLGGRCRDCAF